jgi:hypothetical protein
VAHRAQNAEAVTRPVRENWPFSIDTTTDEEGQLWATITFLEPDGEQRAYGYDRDGTVFLIESLRVALEILEADQGN